MNFKLIGLGMLATSLLVNCGGSKNETLVDDSTILAVRSLEDSSVVDASERTQVALLSGDISTPEKAQIAAENARWVPISQFSQDDELSFSSDAQVQTVSDSIESIARVRDGQNNQSDNNDRGQSRRRGNNNDRNWRPYQNQKNQQNWNRPYTPRPPAPYYGYSQCQSSYSYIYYAGQCVRPYSPYYNNYNWQPRFYYNTSITYRGYKHNRYNWHGRAHIRFYW